MDEAVMVQWKGQKAQMWRTKCGKADVPFREGARSGTSGGEPEAIVWVMPRATEAGK